MQKNKMFLNNETVSQGSQYLSHHQLKSSAGSLDRVAESYFGPPAIHGGLKINPQEGAINDWDQDYRVQIVRQNRGTRG